MLKHDLKLDEDIMIGETRITLKRKKGQMVTLLIDAPASVVITTSKSKGKAQEANVQQETV